MIKHPYLMGVVLAGGKSRRMGRDKLLVELDGQQLLARAVERLKEQMHYIVVVAPPNRPELKMPDAALIADNHEGFQGPLAGIFAGLFHAEVHGFESIVTIAADTPFFPDDYVDRIMGDTTRIVLPEERQVNIARTPDGLHPVFGHWSLNSMDTISNLLSQDIRKVMAAAIVTMLSNP